MCANILKYKTLQIDAAVKHPSQPMRVV